jgi:hypothetical protein
MKYLTNGVNKLLDKFDDGNNTQRNKFKQLFSGFSTSIENINNNVFNESIKREQKRETNMRTSNKASGQIFFIFLIINLQ